MQIDMFIIIVRRNGSHLFTVELPAARDELTAELSLNTFREKFGGEGITMELDHGNPKYVALAREKYQKDGECEIDDNARVSESDEGAYVQAWVWVAKPEPETRKAISAPAYFGEWPED